MAVNTVSANTDNDPRFMRALTIAATVPLRRERRGWIVPSQSGPAMYVVTPHPTTSYKVAQGIVEPPEGIQPWSCTCPDFELRQLPCKHTLAVAIVVRRETTDSNGSVVTEETKVTYTQDWTNYNAAQCAEKDYFLPMLADLCGTLSRPYVGRGRPSLPMSDMAYATIAKVYSGLSARRFDSDVRDYKAQGLTDTDPHFNSVLRYLRNESMTPALEQLVELSALPLQGVEQDFAIDATGFSTCTYTRWFDEKWGKPQKKHDWVKLHAVTGVITNVITAAEISGKNSHDTNHFKGLLASTAENFTIREMSADKAYSSKANLQAVDDLGATPYVPFKSGTVRGPVARRFDNDPIGPGPEAAAWDRMYHFFSYQRDAFLASYHKRSNVEATFSMLKRKFGGSLRSKSEVGQRNEVLCKVIAHNLCVVIAAMHMLGVSAPSFCTKSPAVAPKLPGQTDF